MIVKLNWRFDWTHNIHCRQLQFKFSLFKFICRNSLRQNTLSANWIKLKFKWRRHWMTITRNKLCWRYKHNSIEHTQAIKNRSINLFKLFVAVSETIRLKSIHFNQLQFNLDSLAEMNQISWIELKLELISRM